IKGTEESTLAKDSSVHLMYRDANPDLDHPKGTHPKNLTCIA
ncbi:unnamed protein product, partial [Porites evermanni]